MTLPDFIMPDIPDSEARARGFDAFLDAADKRRRNSRGHRFGR